MQLRKNKKAVAEQEKKLIYNDEQLAGKGKEIGQSIMAYTQAAKWFEKRVADDYRRKARNSRWLASFFGVLAFMAIAAVLGLTPLKTVVPYVLRVDMNSGFVDIVKPKSESVESPEVKEDKRNIVAYVMARESYNWASQPANYALVQLLSYDNAFQEYRNFQLSSKGYVALMGKVEQFRTEVNAMVPLKNSHEPALKANKDIRTYQVRFTKTLLDINGKPVLGSEPTRWVGTISFDYKNPPHSEGDDWLNPQGFGVRDFTKTQEINGG